MWPGLKVVRTGPRFSATMGAGNGELIVLGSSMSVELAEKDLAVQDCGADGDIGEVIQ